MYVVFIIYKNNKNYVTVYTFRIGIGTYQSLCLFYSLNVDRYFITIRTYLLLAITLNIN